MGGSSTYGYETADGKIHYCVYRDYVLLDEIVPVLKNAKVYRIQDSDGEVITAKSLQDYFSETSYEKEDSKVRGVYKMDGTFIYKFWGDKEYNIYNIS